MIVVHAYSVLGVTHVAMYVPGKKPTVGEPMTEDRLLARAESQKHEAGAASEILDAFESCLEQMHDQGRDVQAVLDV